MKKQTIVIVRTVDARTGKDCDEVVRSRKTLKELIKAKRLIPTDQAARLLGLTLPYVRRLCKAGKVNVERILGRYYFTPKQIANPRPDWVFKHH
jgi:hypothetical protein